MDLVIKAVSEDLGVTHDLLSQPQAELAPTAILKGFQLAGSIA